MKVGDLVIRKTEGEPDWRMKEAVTQRDTLGFGIVIDSYQYRVDHGSCTPSEHPCLAVYYPKIGKIYDIAESLMRKL
jgi:hypothetical protein